MTFFTQILDNVPASSDLLNFIGILTTVIASIYIFKKKLLFPLQENATIKSFFHSSTYLSQYYIATFHLLL